MESFASDDAKYVWMCSGTRSLAMDLRRIAEAAMEAAAVRSLSDGGRDWYENPMRMLQGFLGGEETK